ncbi:MAG: DNA polymerase sliding clamp [Thermoprotei archaeon]
MRATYPNASDFYYILSGMVRLSDEITLNFSEDGIYSRYLTDDKVLMGVLSMPKTVLSDYTIDKPVAYKMNLSELKKVLGKAKSKRSTVTIQEIEGGLKIIITDARSGTKSNLFVKAEQTLLETLQEPKVTPTVMMRVEGGVLKSVIKEAEAISSEATFEADQEKVVVRAEAEGKTYEAHLLKDKPLKELQVNEPGSASYSIEVLKDAVTGASFSDNVDVYFGPNMPMKIEAQGEDGAKLVFWIAPRL